MPLLLFCYRVLTDAFFSIFRPELHAQPDPLDNTLEPHNAWVVSTLHISAAPLRPKLMGHRRMV